MTARRVLVLESQTPFVRGGAEILARELVNAVRARGHEADLVSIPFRDSPRDGVNRKRLICCKLVRSHVSQGSTDFRYLSIAQLSSWGWRSPEGHI